MENSLRQQILNSLQEFSTPHRPIYLVGGGVRDIFLDRVVHDLDFVLPGETRSLANEIARRFNGALYVLDAERHTTRVILGPSAETANRRILLDFAMLRAETLAGDLLARDFTINAMAYDVAQPDQLIDPAGGLADLREKRIRACSGDSLANDPVRVLRAVRQALLFQFRIDPETISQMRLAAPLLPSVSAERLRDELFRLLDGPRASLGIRVLDQVGALGHVLPELGALKTVRQSAPHTLDVWEHTLSVLSYLEQLFQPLVGAYQAEAAADLANGSAVLWLGRFRYQFEQHFNQALVPERSIKALLFLASLYHDIGKPATRAETPAGKVRFLGHEEQGAAQAAQRGRALALSVHEVARLETIVRYHMRIHFMASSVLTGQVKTPPRRSIYRFFNRTGAAGIDICLLALADLRGTYGAALPQELWQTELEICRELIEAYWEKTQEIVSPPRLLTGHDLMNTFGLAPGPRIGRLLAKLREAQAVGEVETKQDALDYLRSRLAQAIESPVQPGEPEE